MHFTDFNTQTKNIFFCICAAKYHRDSFLFKHRVGYRSKRDRLYKQLNAERRMVPNAAYNQLDRNSEFPHYNFLQWICGKLQQHQMINIHRQLYI